MPSLPRSRLVSLVLIVAMPLAAGEAVAQRGGDAPPVRAASERGDRGPPRTDASRQNSRHERTDEQRALSAAVRRVESQTGGQVLSAERIPFDGRDVSRIKVVDSSGRVRVYMDDPQGPRSRGSRAADGAPTRDDDN